MALCGAAAWLVFLCLGLCLAWAGLARAQALLEVPTLTSRVIDQTNTLDAAQKSQLEARLASIEQSLGSQLVVVLVPSTLPEDIADYTQRLGDAWKIGRRDVGDGVLLVVAKNDRRVRIAPAKNLEGAIPDLVAKKIIDRTLTPAFRAGDFAGGLTGAVDQIAGLIRGEGLPVPTAGESPAEGGAPLEELLIFFFAAVPIMGVVLTGVLGRKLGSVATSLAAGGIAWTFTASVLIALGAAVLALVLIGVFGFGSASRGRRSGMGSRGPVIWGGSGGGWGGGSSSGGFGGGGGGFRSGGGGNFGGGGASGGW